MKAQTLYRLGGAALLISALLAAIGNVLYLMNSAAPLDSGRAWLLLFNEVFLLLGTVALYAARAERGGWLALAGFVLLVLSSLYTAGSLSLAIAVAEGAMTNAQLQQASSLALAGQILNWTYYLGAVLLGLALYRAGGSLRLPGALLALMGVASYATGLASFVVPIFAGLSLVTYAWLGWALWAGPSAPVAQPAPQPA